MMPTTHYIWDPVSDNLLMETDEAGETIATYTHEPGVYGELISQHRSGQTHYHHYDAQGNTRAVTDESENVVETATYSAFGETVEKTSTIANPFGYKGALGYYANPENDDIYVRERTYDPWTGRWLSVDPLLFLDGPNLYVYVHNQPIIGADPSGEITITPIKQLLSPDAKCGAKRMGEACIKWRWRLDPVTKRQWPCSTNFGYIVQKIDFYCEIDRTCQNCPTKKPGKPLFTYLEAIRINRQFRFADDVASGFCFTPTCGIVKHEGEVKFVCEDQTGDLRKSWKGEQEFRKGDCSITGGPLTLQIEEAGKEPAWWKKPANKDKAAKRWFGVLWDCCGCGDFKCLAKAEPGRAANNAQTGGGPRSACQ